METFPFNNEQDAKKFGISLEDPAIKNPMEGGYDYTRPRHTRTPRRSWTSGLTYLTQAQMDTFTAFWNTVHGSSDIFLWKYPITGALIEVRFDGSPDFKYVGAGLNFRWDVTFKVKEV
jgi:hypothetical protein